MAHPVKNLLLDAYIKEAGSDILARFEAVPLPFKCELFRPGERPRFVHFLTSGIASLVAILSEGREVEVSMTGHEGFSEAVYLLGPEPSLRFCLMQAGGSGLRMPFAQFEKLFEEDAVLRRLVLRLVQNQTMLSTQLTACNGQHSAEERLARWLLMVQDRLGSPELPLTQEFLAQMLGSRRSTVTLAASKLQRAGTIDYHRGQIRVLDREQLMETACECYDVVRQLYRKLYAR